MRKLAGLAVLAVLVYLALTRGLPWLETATGSGDAGEADGSALCVAEASAAADTVAGELIPAARPPVDEGLWGTALVRGARVLASAEDACSCPTAACAKGYEAVQELRRLYDDLDDLARGNPAGLANPARHQERVYDLLDQARAHAE